MYQVDENDMFSNLAWVFVSLAELSQSAIPRVAGLIIDSLPAINFCLLYPRIAGNLSLFLFCVNHCPISGPIPNELFVARYDVDDMMYRHVNTYDIYTSNQRKFS